MTPEDFLRLDRQVHEYQPGGKGWGQDKGTCLLSLVGRLSLSRSQGQISCPLYRGCSYFGGSFIRGSTVPLYSQDITTQQYIQLHLDRATSLVRTPYIVRPPCFRTLLNGFRSTFFVRAQRWKKLYAKSEVRPDSVFASLGYYGLISFSDYLFLLTILASEWPLPTQPRSSQSGLIRGVDSLQGWICTIQWTPCVNSKHFVLLIECLLVNSTQYQVCSLISLLFTLG